MTDLFPETSHIVWFTEKHFRFLELCLLHNGRILQKYVINKLKINSSTISNIKKDFIEIGWCKDVLLGSGKEIEIRLCKINEIRMFISGWKFIGQTIPIRPHDISARGLFLNQPKNFQQATEKMTGKNRFRLLISQMKNNKKYTVKTDYGKIIFHLKGKMIQFWVDGFILPVLRKDITLLEDYICNGVEERIFKLQSLLKDHFDDFRIEVKDCVVLKNLSVGILTKKNVSKVGSLLSFSTNVFEIL